MKPWLKRWPEQTALQRFLSHVIPEPNSGCWLWDGSVRKDGYGRFMVSNAAGVVTAHRFAYENLVAAIPRDLVIDHKCRVRCCVNPAHMRVVTMTENTMVGDSPHARHARKTHCAKGHPLVPCVSAGRKRRRCPICNIEAGREWRKKA